MIDGHGLDTAQAGMLSMVELVTMGVAMLAFAPFTAALTAKRTVLPALTIAIVAQLLTIVAPDYFILVLARSMSGLAFAVMFTLAVVEGSRSHAPERVFATAGIVSLALGAGKVLLLGYAKEWSPHDGVFLGLVIYYLVIGLPLFVLAITAPPPPPKVNIAEPVTFRPSLWVIFVALAIMGFYSFATGGVFAFTQQVGASVGLASSDLGKGTAAITLLGAFGGLAAERLGVRRGRILPTVSALVISGVVCLSVMLAMSVITYWLAMISYVIAYWFSYPYILGLAAHFDRRGSLAALMAAVMILTAAAGTAISGLLTQWLGPASFGWTALAICWGAAILAAILLIRDRRIRTAGASSI